MKVSVSAFARYRLFSIWKWVRDNSSRHNADKLESRIMERVDGLARHPLKGPIEPALAFMDRGHRYLIHGRYKIIYRVEGALVIVTDFFDTKQHPSRMRG